MVGRVVEIATDGRHLSIFRGFLVVAEHGTEVGRVAMDEVAAVIANAHGLTYTNNALVELSARGVPIILCKANHMPAAIVWPVDGHHVQTGRMRRSDFGEPAAQEAPLGAGRARQDTGARRDARRGRRTKRRLPSSVAKGAVRRPR